MSSIQQEKSVIRSSTHVAPSTQPSAHATPSTRFSTRKRRKPYKTTPDQCTFISCSLGYLGKLYEISRELGISLPYPVASIPEAFHPYLTQDMWNHFKRYHLDEAVTFKCHLTGRPVSLRRQGEFNMMFKCICHKTMLLSDSVKRHYQSCKIVQEAIQHTVNASTASSLDRNATKQPQDDIFNNPPDEALDTAPSFPQQPQHDFDKYLALLKDTNDTTLHARTALMVAAASTTTIEKQEQRMKWLEEQMNGMFTVVKELTERLDDCHERIVVLETEATRMAGPAISVGKFEAASEDDYTVETQSSLATTVPYLVTPVGSTRRPGGLFRPRARPSKLSPARSGRPLCVEEELQSIASTIRVASVCEESCPHASNETAPRPASNISPSPSPLDMVASPVHAALGATISEADPVPSNETREQKVAE